ncbi:HAAS signaling domain-containing protein [Catenulispora rubra]|uniref:HAAS signaling domain-containing protein n=1 Tax=Catenulispora rubra TaxID=280293 RepID=UPI0018925AF0|nr:hypothetical protein [Catenulispora rubra]
MTGTGNQGSDDSGTELIADYLRELESQAAWLPAAAGGELLDDVRSHIEVALAEADGPGPAAVRRILQTLGEPAEIVAAALADLPTVTGPAARPGVPGAGALSGTVLTDPGRPQKGGVASQEADIPPFPLGRQEIAAVLLLLFGGFLFLAGWFVGLLLLWDSPRWRLREKVIGTFAPPGGLMAVVVAAGVGVNTTHSASCAGPVGVASTCDHLPGGSPWYITTALVVATALPFVTAFHLVCRARQTTSAQHGRFSGAAPAGVIGAVVGVLALVFVAGAAFITGASEKGGGGPWPTSSSSTGNSSSQP